MRKICVITGTRAEYGLLSRLMKMIQDDKTLQLQIVVTNMHLMPEFGNTYREIEADGFVIDKKVPMSAPTNDANGVVKSMSMELSGLADALQDLSPDMMVILGDRYEMLMAASTALIYKIPIAHLYGGEITEGAFDDAIRHAITKMSHLHFTSTEEYRQRVIQMGENPERVFYVGSIGVENAQKVSLMSKEDLMDSLHFNMDKNTVVATYHPVTLSNNSIESQINAFLEALDEMPNLKIIFTMPNSDTGGKIIMHKLNEFVQTHIERATVFTSLGMKRYLSVLQYVGAVIGNSSSGLCEVPSFGIPTLNIGDRQKGRISCDSVVNCGSTKEAVQNGLRKVLSPEMADIAKHVRNPYEKKNTAENIFKVIKSYPLDNLLQKQFYNLEE